MTEQLTEMKGEIVEEKTLISADRYLKTGCHIGTKFKTGDMRRYIFKIRKDDLKVLDIETIDDKIKIAAKFLAGFKGSDIVIVGRRLYSQVPVKKFSELIGGTAITGRFVPGTFTNPNAKIFIEPRVVVVTEPDLDFQAVKEATGIKIPVVALASTNNSLKNVDLVIPANNKGRKSIALIYWLLTREILRERGELKKEADFDGILEEFEYQLKDSDEAGEERGESDGRRRMVRGKYSGGKGGGKKSKSKKRRKK